MAPAFGTLDDFDCLLDRLHARDIRLILDFVPNHTSDQHAWFQESRSSRTNPKRDWYVWADPGPDGGPPNNWLSRFGGSAWEWDATTGQYYVVVPHMPGPPMKIRMLLVIAALLLCSGPTFAQSVGEKTGVSGVLGVSPSTPDFVQQAAISDMFEIQSSELATQRADAPTKVFAEQMVSAHRKTSDELKGLVASGKVKEAPPTKLDSAHQEKLDTLKGLKGADFSKQYRSDQVEAHEDAVSLFERYANGGDNPTLKDWAGKTLPELKRHLEVAEKLEK